MVDESNYSPYERAAYLATVPAADRAIAEELCAALEDAFPAADIRLYRGFPVVVRDMEWFAGFAMRKKCPMVYCCSPEVLQAMGEELAPLMSGKSCLELRRKGGLTVADGLALVRRAFKVAAEGHGMICKADLKKREKARRAADEAGSASVASQRKPSSTKVAAKKATPRNSTAKRVVTKPKPKARKS